MFRSTIAVAGAAALIAGTVALTANAAPTTAEECVQADLVWVHVQYDETVTGACADEFGTAAEALLSTGLTTDTDAWLTTVDGRSADSAAHEYWGVWTLSPSDAGAYDAAAWEFAAVGITELQLSAGDVLGISLEPDWNVEATAPSVNPVDGVVLTAPTTSPTVSESAKPTVSATPGVSVSPSVSASPTRTGSGTTVGLPSSGN